MSGPDVHLDAPQMENCVPLVLWCYWSGKPMNPDRRRALATMRAHVGVPVRLLTEETVDRIVLPGAPLHPALPYMSDVHRSDYLRAYLLHHHGGAWYDIKGTHVAYRPLWKMFSASDIYLVGRPEVPGGPAPVRDPEGRCMPDHWRDLVSASGWIGRPGTPLSEAVLRGLERILDENMEALERSPSRHPRDRKIEGRWWTRTERRLRYGIGGRNTRYPLPWTLFGNVFHPMVYKFRQHVSQKLPHDAVKNAGIRHG